MATVGVKGSMEMTPLTWTCDRNLSRRRTRCF